jgi:hypothetical protein
MSVRLTKRPLMRGRESASFLRQSYLMRLRQIRRDRLAWKRAMRARRASGKYIPIRPPLLSKSSENGAVPAGSAVTDVAEPGRERTESTGFSRLVCSGSRAEVAESGRESKGDVSEAPGAAADCAVTRALMVLPAFASETCFSRAVCS